ncbi:MAG TPA: hypothetical protein VF235_01695 [Actinomycetota bacterium]
MPVVHVRGVAVDRSSAPSALVAIAGEVAAAVPCAVNGVWCTFTATDVQTVGAEVRDGEGRIVYVDVWIRPREEDPEASARALEAACRATAAGFGVPVEDVWGTLRPVEPRRVFAGGAPVED